MADGNPWSVKQHNWKFETKEEPKWTKQQTKSFPPHTLNNFRSRHHSSVARSTGVQLKNATKISTVIGLITKHADRLMTFKLYPIRLGRVIIFRY